MLRPHNQFLFFALEYGLLGAFLSLIALGCLVWFFGRSTGLSYGYYSFYIVSLIVPLIAKLSMRHFGTVWA